MNKKLVSLALACSLVAGSMSLGFAAGELTASIEDKDVVSAVERLSAFGIVDGMDDGKYHPELEVTREQFAKVLVEALGLGSAAKAAQGGTQFADVESGRWSAGYVNVAVGQGILKGYPDGTFQPAKKVTYAEAVTMLVRALGYQDSFLPGSWPGNYVAKAADAGITDDVTFTADGFADRGSMAIMVNNTLDANVVKVKEYGNAANGSTTYEEDKDLTLLEDKLEIDKYTDLRLVKNQRLDDTLDANEMVFAATKDDTKLLEGEEDKNEEFGAIEFLKEVDSEALMGMKVKIYVNDDDEVLYMEQDGNEKVVIDQIDKIEGDEVTLYKLDDEFEMDKDDVFAYVTGDEDKAISVDEVGDFEVGEFGRFVVSGDEIVFADVVKANETSEVGMVVTSIDEKNKEITGVVAAGESDPEDDFVIDLEDDYDEFTVINALTREVMSFDDIEKEDVIYVAKQEIDGDDYAAVMVVKKSTIEGDLGKYKADEIKIGDKMYDLATKGDDVQATFSINENDDIYSYSQKFEADEDIEDAYGEKITAITDVVGRVIHFVTDAEATSGSLYGVVDKVYDDGERVKLYLASEDKMVTYDTEDDDDAVDLEKGQFIEFKLNADGEIAEDELTVADDKVYTVDKEFGDDTISTTGGDVFSVDEDSTVFINAADSNDYPVNQDDIDDVELVKWADIAEDDVNTETNFVAFFDEDTDELDAVLFVNGLDSTSDEEAVYVVDTFKAKDGDEVAEIDAYNGKLEEVTVDSKSEDEMKDEMVAVVKRQSDGELELKAYIDGNEIVDNSEDFDIVTGEVVDKDGNFIYLEKGGKGYRLSSSTIVYDEDDKKSKSNISKGDFVDLVVEDGKNVRVASLLEEAREIETDEEVAAVKELIADLPDADDVTLDDKDDIEEARAAYDDLDEDQQAKVNTDRLEDAEKALEDFVPAKSVEADYAPISASLPTFGTITITVEGYDNAVEYTVTYELASGAEQTTDAVAIDEKSGSFFKNDTVKVNLLDADGEVIDTVEVTL